MSKTYMPYDAACVDCRREAGKDPAGVTTQCIGHVYLERDALRQQLADERANADLLTARVHESASTIAELKRERTQERKHTNDYIKALHKAEAQLTEAREREATFHMDYRQKCDVETKALRLALEAERAAHAQSRADWNTKWGEAGLQRAKDLQELALARREKRDLQSAIDTNVEVIRMMQSQRDEARRERDQEEEQKGEWIEVANNFRLERDRALALLRECRPFVVAQSEAHVIGRQFWIDLLARLDALISKMH